MKTFVSALIPALVLANTVSAAPANDKAVRKTIQAQYASYQRATMHYDVAAIMNLLTPDFKWHLLDGTTLDRQQTQKELVSFFHTAKIEAMTVTVHKVTVKNDTVTTLVTEKTTALTATSGKPTRTVTKETYRELWVHTPQGWKIQDTQLLK